MKIKDAGEAEVVVVSIGPDRVTQALRTALGMGADRAIHVKDPETDGSDALGVAKILGAIAKEQLGKASRYMEIFEANQPMLKDPNLIYPGQTLRIPAE